MIDDLIAARPKLLSAARYQRHRDPAVQPEDLVQDAYLELLALKTPLPEDPAHRRAYAYQIIRHRAIDIRRSPYCSGLKWQAGNEEIAAFGNTRHAFRGDPDPTRTPEELAILHEQLEAVIAAARRDPWLRAAIAEALGYPSGMSSGRGATVTERGGPTIVARYAQRWRAQQELVA